MAGGVFGGGDGSQKSPFLIEDGADLYQMRNHPTSYFKLISNINLGEPPYNEKRGWEPINSFRGRLDGNYKKIFNLTIARQDEDDIGLFSVIDANACGTSTPCYNICFEETNIIGGNNVGALCGRFIHNNDTWIGKINFSIIQNCYVDGNIEGKNNVGGFIGKIDSSASATQNRQLPIARDSISNCSLALSNADSTFIGQFVGIISDKWNNSCQYTHPNFYNTLATGSISPNSKTPTKPGNYFYDLYNQGVYTNSYMDNALWGFTNFGDTTLKCMDTSELKSIANQADFATILNDDKISHKFSLYDGRYVQLAYQSPDYFFIKADDNFYTYDFTTSKWILKYNLTPSRQQAIINGMRALQDVPQTAWDYFKTFQNVSIIDILDKKDSTLQTTQETELDIDATHTSDDNKKMIVKQKFYFNTRIGNLSKLTGW